MTLGYCLKCDRLVAITAGQLKHPEGRDRHWYPVTHDTPPRHIDCGGYVHDGECARCAKQDPTNVTPPTDCDGTKRSI